jgi:hypothetical protein
MTPEQVFANFDVDQVDSSTSQSFGEEFEPTFPIPRKPNVEERCHPQLGAPTTAFKYCNADGELEGYVCRWDRAHQGNSEKEFRPLRFGTFKGRKGFHWKGWKGPARPLYRLPALINAPRETTVLLVEGEKTVDCAVKLFPELVVITPMNGAQSPHLADMSPLSGRKVVIWPDHDDAGADFAIAVAKLALAAGAASAAVVKLPPDFPPKWDLADPLPAGFDIELLRRLIAEAVPICDVGLDGPDMSIVSRVRNTPPAFPAEVFGPLKTMLEELAASTSTPIDYTAMATLVVGAAVIGNARAVSPWDSWQEPSCLWGAIVGNPSSGKSPALSPLIGAVHALETDDAADFSENQRAWETSAEAARQTRELWEKQVKDALKKGAEVPKLPPEAVEPAAPSRPRIIVSDTTPEALANILVGQPRGLLSFRDELSGWLGSFDRYTGAQAERAFWLEAFGGRRHVVDRVKHGAPVIIPRLLVSVLGGIQPDKLTTSLLSGDDDGLSARMLMTWPTEALPHRPTVSVNPELILECMRRLRSLEMTSDSDGGGHPVVLKLSNEAADLFDDWRQRHFKASANVAGKLAGHFGKYPGLLLRLALVLEHLWWSVTGQTPPTSISLAAVTNAARLLDEYFRPMAECIYGDAAMPESERLETILARWILKNKPAKINARDLRRNQRLPGLREHKKVHETLAALVEAGWLKEAPTRQGGTPGRAREDYLIDPRVYSAEKCTIQ